MRDAAGVPPYGEPPIDKYLGGSLEESLLGAGSCSVREHSLQVPLYVEPSRDKALVESQGESLLGELVGK